MPRKLRDLDQPNRAQNGVGLRPDRSNRHTDERHDHDGSLRVQTHQCVLQDVKSRM
jgi:hypothetical protein